MPSSLYPGQREEGSRKGRVRLPREGKKKERAEDWRVWLESLEIEVKVSKAPRRGGQKRRFEGGIR